MTGFIATANPPTAATELPVENDPWYPAIDTAHLRTTCRLDGTVTPARLQHALLDAIATVNGELIEWRAMQQAAGHTSLADVPAHQLNGESVNAIHYRRAIYAAVQADLSEVYREIDTTPQSAGKSARVGDQLAIKTSIHHRTLRWALSDLMGHRRTMVELI